jgi:hypothetical protein
VKIGKREQSRRLGEPIQEVNADEIGNFRLGRGKWCQKE